MKERINLRIRNPEIQTKLDVLLKEKNIGLNQFVNDLLEEFFANEGDKTHLQAIDSSLNLIKKKIDDLGNFDLIFDLLKKQEETITDLKRENRRIENYLEYVGWELENIEERLDNDNYDMDDWDDEFEDGEDEMGE